MLHRTVVASFFLSLFLRFSFFFLFLSRLFRVIFYSFYSSTAVVGQHIAPRCCSFPGAMERKNNVKLLLAVPLEQEVLSASWALFFVLSIAAVAAAHGQHCGCQRVTRYPNIKGKVHMYVFVCRIDPLLKRKNISGFHNRLKVLVIG